MEIRKNSDLVLVAALSALVLVVRAFAGSATAITVVPAALLVLVLPGYALTAFALPGAGANTLERCALSLGVSLAVAALFGMILHLTPWGLTGASWTVALVAVTWLGCILAGFRRQAAVSDDTFAPARFALDTRAATMIGAAALVCGGALYVSSRPPSELATQGYTLLWAIPDAGGVPVVHVGVENFDTGPRQYLLNAAWGDQSVQQWNVQLDVNNTWRADLDLSNQAPHLAEDLQLSLYSADDPNTPIRQTTLRTGDDASIPIVAVAAPEPAAPAVQATVQPTAQPTLPPPVVTPTAASVSAAPQITPTPSAAQVWQAVIPQLDAAWGKDTPKTVQLLRDYLVQFPDDGTARDKLYAALIARAQDLASNGQPDAAASDLAEAQQLFPNRLEAPAALIRLTPTPTPTLEPQAETAPLPPPPAAPRPAPVVVRQPTPAPPAQRAPAPVVVPPAPVVRTAPTPTKVPFVAPPGG